MATECFTFGPEQQVVVEYFVRNFAADPGSFIPRIDRRCQMYAHGIAEPESCPGAAFTYFDSALKMLHPLRVLANWKFGGLTNCGRLLDFASGFGRLTRFLVQEMHPGALVVSDIQAEAVDFQQRTFGVDGFASVTDPATLRHDKLFDAIFVASLFTHLPEHRFHAWLAKLVGLLTPRGMLVFTVHDASLLARHRPVAPSGFDFNPHVSEVGSLAAAEYGSTHVSQEFVNRALDKASQGTGGHHRIPRGLWHHDVYVYTPDGSAGRDKPGIGILGPQNIIGIHDGRVTPWFTETSPAHRVSSIELVTKGGVRTAGSAKGAVAFAGDGRFLPDGWNDPLYAVFDDVPHEVFANDVVLRAESSGGDVRRMPVWSRAITLPPR
jgi:SAM-dependent methyltransferase